MLTGIPAPSRPPRSRRTCGRWVPVTEAVTCAEVAERLAVAPVTEPVAVVDRASSATAMRCGSP